MLDWNNRRLDFWHAARPKTALNVTPCNYARVWRDNPSEFVEFATLARFARSAASTELRSEGQRLATALGAKNTNAILGVMGNLVTTCERLGLVRSVPTTPTTPTS